MRRKAIIELESLTESMYTCKRHVVSISPTSCTIRLGVAKPSCALVASQLRPSYIRLVRPTDE